MNKTSRGAAELAEAVKDLYAASQTDYGLEPLVSVDRKGNPIGRIGGGDSVVFCCRRGEREIELTEAFTDPNFTHFERTILQDLDFVIMTLYHDKFKDLPVAFAPAKIRGTLGEVVSREGLRQLKVSESEKFAHVTFFFNGGENVPFVGEDQVRIPSPKGIPFDQVPELSLVEVGEKVVDGIRQRYDLIVTNFANGDVIGHTSNREAKIQCAAHVDQQLGRVVEAGLAAGYVILVTADHGNLEELTNPDGLPNVAHTTNKVPFLLIDPGSQNTFHPEDGRLADVAPTILSALDIEKPVLMSGSNLVPDYDWGGKRRVLLVILDGWGIGRQDDNNPIFLAKTPVWDEYNRRFPGSQLQAAGDAVGLNSGKAGNSEAGHMNLGAGRVVLQDDVRLDQAMQDGSFFMNEILCQAIERVKKHGTSLHLIGLLTEKSSHGSIDYPIALLKMARQHGLDHAFLHIIFDGRSTEPGSAPALLKKLESQLDAIGIGQVVSGVGRGIALDRDGNYSKIKRTYDALVKGIGRYFAVD
jgi:2,3-bisphosphoglycerate-independent phosphoglycerate mutase